MSVEIKIQFNNKYLIIPINPESISRSRSASNDDIDIIGIGAATRKGSPGLESFTIESFFPGPNSYYYKGASPKTCIDFIDTIWKSDNTNNTVGKITSVGLPVNINMYFVIENFDFDHKAGEEDDVYYTLKFKEYIPYGVRKISTSDAASKGYTSRANSASNTSSKSTSSSSKSKTYTVKKGDCLWNISKAASGSGSNWKKLYDLNKKVIGSNPNLIYPGQKLTLPSSWKVPTSSTKKSSV